MNRSKVRSLVEGVIEKPQPEKPQPEKPQPEKPQPEKPQPEKPQPESVTAPTPVSIGSADDAFRNWTRTSQWEQNITLRGINPQRLQSVMQSRVEAAFRAGYAAGLGDAI